MDHFFDQGDEPLHCGLDLFRKHGVDRLFARIACLKADGRDRSLSQKKPGWNYLLMPRTSEESQFVPNLAPRDDEIVLCKTTDSTSPARTCALSCAT
jgi:nicotinamidase-related amidase